MNRRCDGSGSTERDGIVYECAGCELCIRAALRRVESEMARLRGDVTGIAASMAQTAATFDAIQDAAKPLLDNLSGSPILRMLGA